MRSSLAGGICMTRHRGKSSAEGVGRRQFLRAAVAGVSVGAGLSTMRVWGGDIDTVYAGKLLVTL